MLLNLFPCVIVSSAGRLTSTLCVCASGNGNVLRGLIDGRVFEATDGLHVVVIIVECF